MNSELAELRDRIAELELEIEELKSQNARKDEEIANLQNKWEFKQSIPKQPWYIEIIFYFKFFEL